MALLKAKSPHLVTIRDVRLSSRCENQIGANHSGLHAEGLSVEIVYLELLILATI